MTDEQKWVQACLERDSYIDGLSGRRAATVHHVISRKWSAVRWVVDNGLSVEPRTHELIHRNERASTERIITHVIGTARYARIVELCKHERGFRDTFYWELYEKYCGQG